MKTFTALTILQLVEKDKCKLSDRAAAYLPEVPSVWRNITIEHLLRQPLRDSRPTEYMKTITYADRVDRRVFDIPLSFRLGSKVSIQQSRLSPVGNVSRGGFGESWSDYVRKHIS
jgi:hypothetical protein